MSPSVPEAEGRASRVAVWVAVHRRTMPSRQDRSRTWSNLNRSGRLSPELLMRLGSLGPAESPRHCRQTECSAMIPAMPPVVCVRAIVLDCPDPLALSGFYATLLGWPPAAVRDMGAIVPWAAPGVGMPASAGIVVSVHIVAPAISAWKRAGRLGRQRRPDPASRSARTRVRRIRTGPPAAMLQRRALTARSSRSEPRTSRCKDIRDPSAGCADPAGRGAAAPP